MIKVAIADDNENMIRMLTDIVSRDSELHVVGTAKNGEEACEIIREKEPDIVLLDIVMPKLDGLGVMDRMNRDKNMKKHPNFIIISAIGQENVTEDAFRLGASYYIMKPFDQEALLTRIKLTKRSVMKSPAGSEKMKCWMMRGIRKGTVWKVM